ncbi:DNA repair protein rad50, partial [Coemansia aciculifera]
MSIENQRQIESQGSDNQEHHRERDQLQLINTEAQREIDELLSEIGRLQAARDSLESLIASRAVTIAETISATSLSSSNSQDPDCQAEDCAAQIDTHLSHASTERVEVRRRAESRERELQAEINAVQSQIYDFNNAVALGEKHASSNLQEVGKLREKYDALQPDESVIRRTEEEMASERRLLAAAQAQNSEAMYNDQAKQKRLELGGVAEEIVRLNAEIARNSMQADTRAKLALRRSELEDKQARRTELAAIGDLLKYKAGLGLSANIAKAIEAKKKDIVAAESEAKKTAGQLADKKMRRNMAVEKKISTSADVAAKQTAIYIACTGGKYDETVAHLKGELQTVLEMAGHYKSASSMYKAYIQKVETDHACPVCQRGWSDKADEARLVSKLKLDYTSAPTELLKLEEETRDLERQLSKLSSLQSSARDIEEWESSKGMLEDQINELNTAVEGYEHQVVEADALMEILDSELASLTELLAKAGELEELERGCSELGRQIEMYEHELLATGSIKTADELQREISQFQLQEAEIRRELDRLAQDRTIKHNEIGFRQDNIRRLQDSISDLSRQADERAMLLERIAALEAANVEIAAENQVARSKADAVVPQLQQCTQRLADFRAEARGQEALIDQRVRDLTQSKDQLAHISREIANTRALLA